MLDYENEWAAESGFGYALAAQYGLKNCTPIMCETSRSHDSGVIFESEGKFYYHDQLTLGIYVYVRPETLEDIIAVMKGEKKGRIVRKEDM